MSKKTKWLNNAPGFIGQFTLCFDEKQYFNIMRELNIKHYDRYDDIQMAYAWVKTFVRQDGYEFYLVCLSDKIINKSIPTICNYLAHEATHVFQNSCKYLGENSPSKEFEAYAIGHITGELVNELFNKKFKRLVK